MSVGIGAIRTLLPSATVAVDELPEFAGLDDIQQRFAVGTGIKSIGILDDEGAAVPAARVSRALVENGRRTPDALIVIGPRAPDLLLASDTARILHEAAPSVPLAFTLDGMGCTGSSLAWGIAADLLRADPTRNEILVTHCSRPTGLDRVRAPVTVIGDGACAMTITRTGWPQLRSHRTATDGAYHDLFSVDYKSSVLDEWREICGSDRRYRFELAVRSHHQLSLLVDEACADLGIDRSEIRHTLMQNVTTAAYAFYENVLDLSISPVCAEVLSAYGHLGAMDVIVNMERLLAGDDIAAGDLILVLNNSPVAAWAATIWQA